MCLTYLCCKYGFCRCCRRAEDENGESGRTVKTDVNVYQAYNVQEYDDIVYIAQKREIKVTVSKGVKAGILAGLCVMGGVIVAGPVGAAVGGAMGTGAAMSISKDVVSLNQLLEQTPNDKRGEVINAFRDAIQEEFQGSIQNNPELKLVLSGGTILGVMRYALDRDLIESEKLGKLDTILNKIT